MYVSKTTQQNSRYYFRCLSLYSYTCTSKWILSWIHFYEFESYRIDFEFRISLYIIFHLSFIQYEFLVGCCTKRIHKQIRVQFKCIRICIRVWKFFSPAVLDFVYKNTKYLYTYAYITAVVYVCIVIIYVSMHNILEYIRSFYLFFYHFISNSCSFNIASF